ncbi:unnamed protein product, partial [Laminaria digitata]
QKQRRQVEAETHEALLGCEGLVEPEATNQRAWLTESAGALADLHASVLEGLSGFTPSPSPSVSPYSDYSSSARRLDISTRRLDNQSSSSRGSSSSSGGLKDERAAREGAGSVTSSCCGRFGRGGNANSGKVDGSHDVGGCAAAAPRVATTGSSSSSSSSSSNGDDAGDSGGGGRPSTTTIITSGGDGRVQADQQRRTRLHHLGRLLARRRQFTASRQAFDDAIRGGPDEQFLRERNKAHTSGFFLDMSLEEASPTIRLDLESR